MRPAVGVVAAQLLLGGLDEDTTFIEFDVDCDADLILGYDWLRSHGLAFLYDTNEVCLCAERRLRSCTSGRRVLLELTLDCPASECLAHSPRPRCSSVPWAWAWPRHLAARRVPPACLSGSVRHARSARRGN